jgi:phage terminase small subunit
VTDAPKLTPKQEAFAQAYIETGNATEAYRRAFGDKKWAEGALHVQASKLLSKPKVRLRVDALQAMHAKRHNLTVDDLVDELEEARSLAKEIGQASAAVGATMGKAKLLGLVIDKTEQTGKDGGPIIHDVRLTKDDIRALREVLE